VGSGGGDLERAFRRVLPPHLREVDAIAVELLGRRVPPRTQRLGRGSGAERTDELDHRAERGERVYGKPVDDGRFLAVLLRDDEPREPEPPARDRDGERAAHGPDAAVEPELTVEQRVVEVSDAAREVAVRGEDANRDREVESGAGLLDIGGCEVHRHAHRRERNATVGDRGADALPRLANGGVRKTDHDEAVLHEVARHRRDVDLGVDRMGLDADQRRRLDGKMHALTVLLRRTQPSQAPHVRVGAAGGCVSR
jgi:hypothetical protein